MLSATPTQEESIVLPTTPPLPQPEISTTTLGTEQAVPSAVETPNTSSTQKVQSTVTSDGISKASPPGKRPTRQWDAWTREEEETFFIALRHVGKNFDKITSRVQSKNKDQVRHYYYRLIRRINKLLGPDFCLDAKNSKDVNSAMLRWWSLLEKQSCSASKLHLKPRRFKTFVTALEHQIMKDRMKASKQRPPRSVPVISGPVSVDQLPRKPCACGTESVRTIQVESSRGPKTTLEHSSCVKQKAMKSQRKKKEPNEHPRKRKKAAATQNWEDAANSGVALVAEAAEQLERAAAETLAKAASSLQPLQISPDKYPVSASDMTNEEKIKETSTEQEKQTTKLKLQLFPIDDNIRKSMTQDGLNPYLELTLKPRKAISSVVRHLNQKWGGTSAAVGRLHLFPFDVKTKVLDNCQSWTEDDTTSTAGDVYTVLGNPSVFRLRYGWFRLQAEYAQKPSTEGTSVNVLPNVALNASHVFLSSDVEKTSGHQIQVNRDTDHLSAKVPTDVHTSSEATSQHVSVFKATSISEFGKNNSCLDGVSTGNPINTLCQGSGVAGSLDKTVNKEQENVGNLEGSSWLYEGSNDSFVQRIWAAEDPANASALLPTEMDWADSLTNISVGEFLNDVSQAGRLGLGTSSEQALQPMQSLDSFDAAVAAQSTTPVIQSPHNQPETPAWDGEDTRDAFSFRKVVSQKQSSVPTERNAASSSLVEALRESDASILPFADCGSLDAWKQSFSHSENLLPDELKCDSASRLFHQHVENLIRGGHSDNMLLDELKCDSASRFFHQHVENLIRGGCSQDAILQLDPPVENLEMREVLASIREECRLPKQRHIGNTSLDVSEACSGAPSCGPSMSSTLMKPS